MGNIIFALCAAAASAGLYHFFGPPFGAPLAALCAIAFLLVVVYLAYKETSADYKNFSPFMRFMLRFIFPYVGKKMCAEKARIRKLINEECAQIKHVQDKAEEQKTISENTKQENDKSKKYIERMKGNVGDVAAAAYCQDVRREESNAAMGHSFYEKFYTHKRHIFTLECEMRDIEKSAENEVFTRIMALTSFIAAVGTIISLVCLFKDS